MDPSTTGASLADRAANVHAALHQRWGSVPHSSRVIDAGEYEYPDSPDDVFPHVSVGFVVDEADRTASSMASRVLVCRDAKHDDLVWEPPGGRGRPDETPAETAEREILEETGFEAEVRALLATEVLWFDHGHAVLPVLQAVFVAEYVAGSLDPEADIDPRWFSVDDLPAETQYGAVVQSVLAPDSG